MPNSKIRLFYRIIGTKYNVDIDKVSATVDIKINKPLESFTSGKDIELEYVLNLIKK